MIASDGIAIGTPAWKVTVAREALQKSREACSQAQAACDQDLNAETTLNLIEAQQDVKVNELNVQGLESIYGDYLEKYPGV